MKIIREYEIDEERKKKVIGTQEYQYIGEKVGDMFIETHIYFFEKGKTTLKGKYPKLANNENCKYPKRLSCNYGPGYERCKYMEYGGSLGNWICTYKEK